MKMAMLVTELGGAGLLLPAAVVLLGYLIAWGAPGAAFRWFVALAGVAASIVLLKLATHACAAHFGLAQLISPSGHAALSGIVYGGGAVALGKGRRGGWLLLAAAGAVVVAIGATRVILRAHTPTEVAVGAALG